MAIFSSTKKTTKAPKATKVTTAKRAGASTPMFNSVIVSPRITEKASMQAQGNVYTFNVTPSATKLQISHAIHALFKVVPRKVAIINMRSNNVVSKGKRGKTAAGKKAYVFLEKGDTIEIV